MTNFIKYFIRGLVLGMVILSIIVPSVYVVVQPEPHPKTSLAVTNSDEVAMVSYSVKMSNDNRANILRDFLTKKNSPLAENSATFVAVADEYGFDWRFLPAITGIESSFGLFQLPNSYNPFGWGGGYMYFTSFDESIKTVGKGLYDKSVYKGEITPEGIGPTYCPPNYSKWVGAVNRFMNEIETARTASL